MELVNRQSKSARPIEVRGELAFIPLTKGKTAVIDAADVPLVQHWNWCADPHGNIWYAHRAGLIDGRRRVLRLHNALMGAQPGKVIDHINGDGLDNRRCNLRFCDHKDNMRNRRRGRPEATHERRGVYSVRDKYQARITVDGREISLGLFDTEAEAVSTRRWAEVFYKKEYAPDLPLRCAVNDGELLDWLTDRLTAWDGLRTPRALLFELIAEVRAYRAREAATQPYRLSPLPSN